MLIVMRSDAVLRVVLNVQLFPGMKCGHEQEVFIRIVAMEENGLVHLALKVCYSVDQFGNMDDAEQFYNSLKSHIPDKV